MLPENRVFSSRILFWGTTLFVVIWLTSTYESWFYGRWNHQLKGIGNILGVTGYTLFALSLFLSSRWKKLELWFGGLDKIYSIHHKVGVWAFIFILAHPFILALKWFPQRVDHFFLFFLPIHPRLSVNLGSLAFWLMVVIIGITILKLLPYDKWKITHKFMSFVFILASLHIILTTKKFSTALLPQLLLFLPMVIGLWGIIYKQVYISLFAHFPIFEVVNTQKLNDNVVEICFCSKEKKLNYIPGQYVFCSFEGKHLTKESHPFTLSGSPQGDLSILVKARGDYTKILYEHIKEGYRARIEGPYGRFYFAKGRAQQIWISGGIGITPFIAWIRFLLQYPHLQPHKISLFNCYHRKKDEIFTDIFEEAHNKLQEFHYFPFCSENKKHLDVPKIEYLCPKIKDKDVFMCGPKRLTRHFFEHLLSCGVKRENIHFEDFEFF